MAVKSKKHEKLDEITVQRVIDLLEEDKPITKKTACEILNISYNTSRLNKIIDEHKARLEREAKLRKAKRGTPATDFEIKTIIEQYLEGESVAEISRMLFRPASFVKNIVERVGVPTKPSNANYFSASLLPDQCLREDFKVGEMVWSARYHKKCEILKSRDKGIYQIYVFEKIEEPSPYFPNIKVGGFYAEQPYFELGSLQHLKKYGVA